MKKSTKFSPEVREHAMRMVPEVHPEYSSQWAAIQAIAPKIGCTTQTLCNWMRSMNVIPGSAMESARPRHGASKSWSARTGSSSGSTRSCVWQALFRKHPPNPTLKIP